MQRLNSPTDLQPGMRVWLWSGPSQEAYLQNLPQCAIIKGPDEQQEGLYGAGILTVEVDDGGVWVCDNTGRKGWYAWHKAAWESPYAMFLHFLDDLREIIIKHKLALDSLYWIVEVTESPDRLEFAHKQSLLVWKGLNDATRLFKELQKQWNLQLVTIKKFKEQQ